MDLIAIGEILIDLTQTGISPAGIPQFSANPGGAPANLAVAASRLDASTAFIGKVGDDSFGTFLRKTLLDNGVDVSAMAVDPTKRTTMAVVSVDERGERSFCFYRDRTADVMLTADDVPQELLAKTKLVHFGSVSLVAEPARSATIETAKRAKAMGKLVSYDPNYRASLWPDEETALAQMKAVLPLADILKISDEELPLLTGSSDPAQGTALLAAQGITLILLTLGSHGAYYRLGDLTGTVPGVPCKVADTNGAGDTFFGAALSRLVRSDDLKALTKDQLEDVVAFANKAASITTSRPGAIPAMPTLQELNG